MNYKICECCHFCEFSYVGSKAGEIKLLCLNKLNKEKFQNEVDSLGVCEHFKRTESNFKGIKQ